MALPKKGTRKIIVDGTQYRWLGFIQSKKIKMSGEIDELLIELAENPGEKIRANFTFELVKSHYKKAGKHLQSFDRFPPYIVRQTILFALSQGWKPAAGGGVRDLGCLDDKISYSDLKPEIAKL
ncbi:MAG: hypothetical protein IPJ69_03585 [Deltaproteobacteria bacterium]|nr:MAG: hypothetical protein IPJ69_03585 [Deltaproteobacteria bacterium]